jgi:Dullard-like phosphatase family protein
MTTSSLFLVEKTGGGGDSEAEDSGRSRSDSMRSIQGSNSEASSMASSLTDADAVPDLRGNNALSKAVVVSDTHSRAFISGINALSLRYNQRGDNSNNNNDDPVADSSLANEMEESRGSSFDSSFADECAGDHSSPMLECAPSAPATAMTAAAASSAASPIKSAAPAPQQQQQQQRSSSAFAAAAAAAAASSASTVAVKPIAPAQTTTAEIFGLLSQAVRDADNSALSIGVKYATCPSRLTEAQRTLMEQHRARPINSSPTDARRFHPLLRHPRPHTRRHTLCLDLDETLVHASHSPPPTGFHLHVACKASPSAPVSHVYVTLRPFARDFIEIVSDIFEVVIFTASLHAYAEPVLRFIDPKQRYSALLHRDHCSTFSGKHIKDLSLLGRDLNHLAIIDNSPTAYLFQPRNAIPVTSWFDKPDDRELMDLVPMLQQLAVAPTVYDVLDVFRASRESRYE